MKVKRWMGLLLWLCVMGPALSYALNETKSTAAEQIKKPIHKFPTPAPVVYTYASQWGTSGAGAGGFNWPNGVAVDKTANMVYVVEKKNNRVQEFTTAGAFVRQWGGAGSAAGQFNDPNAIALDGLGHVFVSDSLNQRVQIFDLNGNYITSWGSYGAGNGQFSYPYGVAADGSGNIYVVDNVNKRVQKFHWLHILWLNFVQYQAQWPAHWPQTTSGPAAIALSGSSLYVSMANHIQEFDTNGSLVYEWGVSGTTPPHFVNIIGLTPDASGHLLVSDQGQNMIQQWTLGGQYLSSFGGFGSANGKFASCAGLALDGAGNLYVCDRDNNRVQKFSPH